MSAITNGFNLAHEGVYKDLRLKGFRRIFSRFEKFDALFLGFLSFALIVEALRVA